MTSMNDLIKEELRLADRRSNNKMSALIDDLKNLIVQYYHTWNVPIRYSEITKRYRKSLECHTELHYSKILQYLNDTKQLIIIPSHTSTRYIYPVGISDSIDELLEKVIDLEQNKLKQVNESRSKKMRGNRNATRSSKHHTGH